MIDTLDPAEIELWFADSAFRIDRLGKAISALADEVDDPTETSLGHRAQPDDLNLHQQQRKTNRMTTTTEIADKIATEQNLTKAQAKAIVDSVFKEISEAARSGAETSIPGFGKFKIKDTPEREGRNPSTGATIKIAASKKLTFTPAKAIKDALNG